VRCLPIALILEHIDWSTDPTQVCIAELGRLWSSDITLKEIFSLVYGTLLTPDLENPLEIQASLKYCTWSRLLSSSSHLPLTDKF
jgi:ubiquitin-protein ligase